jgi:hypothetical protein
VRVTLLQFVCRLVVCSAIPWACSGESTTVDADASSRDAPSTDWTLSDVNAEARDAFGGDVETDREEDTTRFDATDADARAVDSGIDGEPSTDGDSSDDSPEVTDSPGSDDASPDSAGSDDASPDSATGGILVDPAPCGLGESLNPLNLIVDVGHSNQISLVRRSGDYLLSRDADLHWVLWRTSDRRRMISGDAVTQIDQPSQYPEVGFLDLQGSTLAIETAFGNVQLLDVPSLTVLANISVFSGTFGWSMSLRARAFGLAVDGSYFWEASSTKLKVWSKTGAGLVDRDGNYGSIVV